jgi:hypothetical protein
MAICFDGTNIWVANTNNNKITKLRASDGSILGTYAVGNAPNDLCFDGASIWVTNSGSDSVTKLPKTIMPTATTTTTPMASTTSSVGLQVTTTAQSADTAQSGDTVQVDYTLKLADGSIYQTTVGTGQPFEFTLGQNQVIVGFETAVTGMEIGQTKTVTIPAAQAYGTTTNASNPLAGQDLTFVITLLKIVSK